MVEVPMKVCAIPMVVVMNADIQLRNTGRAIVSASALHSERLPRYGRRTQSVMMGLDTFPDVGPRWYSHGCQVETLEGAMNSTAAGLGLATHHILGALI